MMSTICLKGACSSTDIASAVMTSATFQEPMTASSSHAWRNLPLHRTARATPRPVLSVPGQPGLWPLTGGGARTDAEVSRRRESSDMTLTTHDDTAVLETIRDAIDS